MGEFSEFILPDGRKAVFNQATGGYFIEGTTEEALLKATETMQLKGLHSLAVKRIRQVLNVVFWGLVAFIVKVFISVADQFDNHSARPVAEGVGKTIGIAFGVAMAVLLTLGILGFLSAAGFEFGRAKKKESSLPAIPGNGVENTKKPKRRLRPIGSHAQAFLSRKK